MVSIHWSTEHCSALKLMNYDTQWLEESPENHAEYEFIYMIFPKWQNYGNREQVSGCRIYVCGGEVIYGREVSVFIKQQLRSPGDGVVL